MNARICNNSETVTKNLLEQAAKEVSDAGKVIDEALEKLKTDPGAMFEEKPLGALRWLKAEDPAQFARFRACMAKANRDFRLGELDRLMLQGGGGEDSIPRRLLDLARDKCQLCHDADKRGVAIVERDNHREVWMIRSSGFSDWLRAEYFSAHESGIPDAAMNIALSTIEAFCIHRGALVEVHLRCARIGEAYFIDLCDEQWRAVKIDRSGWEIVTRPKALFTRNELMRPLLSPVPGGDIDRLWKYLNVQQHQRELLVAWMLDSMRPDTPFPVLEIVGEQGSAKSTTQRHIRDLIDPNKVALRGAPKTSEDIYISAANNWTVSYENLSHLSNEAQDVLCTLSTGGGFATRKFYTNGIEHVVETKRPVMLNGISGIASRPDLIERTIRIDSPPISPVDRREDAQIAQEWEADRPLILGALLSLFAKSLAELPMVQLVRKQRMADYEKLGEAMLRSTGRPTGNFSELYRNAVSEGTARALESYSITNALITYMTQRNSKDRSIWTGTVGELYSQLQAYGTMDRTGWPKTPRGLSDQLSRLAPALRAQGLEICFGSRGRNGRQIAVKVLHESSNGIDPGDSRIIETPSAHSDHA